MLVCQSGQMAESAKLLVVGSNPTASFMKYSEIPAAEDVVVKSPPKADAEFIAAVNEKAEIVSDSLATILNTYWPGNTICRGIELHEIGSWNDLSKFNVYAKKLKDWQKHRARYEFDIDVCTEVGKLLNRKKWHYFAIVDFIDCDDHNSVFEDDCREVEIVIFNPKVGRLKRWIYRSSIDLYETVERNGYKDYKK